MQDKKSQYIKHKKNLTKQKDIKQPHHTNGTSNRAHVILVIVGMFGSLGAAVMAMSDSSREERPHIHTH